MIVSKACDYIQSTTLSGLCGRPAVDKSLTHPVTELTSYSGAKLSHTLSNTQVN